MTTLPSILRAALVAAAALLPWSAASAEDYRAEYAIRIADIPIGKADVRLDLNAKNGYGMTASAKVSGLARVVSDGRGGATARGLLSGTRVVPTSYVINSTAEGEKQSVSLVLVGGAVRTASVEPPALPFPDRVPVTTAHRRGVVDPLSATLMPIGAGADPMSPSNCNRTLPIFDGRQRFDVTLSYVRTTEVKTPNNGYAGPALVCKAKYHAVAGHRVAKKQVQYLEENDRLEVWLVPLADRDVLVPWRISIGTMVGALVVEATRFGDGVTEASVKPVVDKPDTKPQP